jgi:uncharacterized membrane protein
MIKVWLDAFGVFIYWVSIPCIPFLFYILCKNSKVLNFLGVTICCFLSGMLIGNIYPRSWIDQPSIGEVNNLLVPIGIILMLFSTDLRRWIRLSFKMLFSYLLSVIAVVGLAITLFFVFNQRNDLKYLSGMTTATYVGGTPNMAAVKIAYGIPDAFYNQAFLSDVVASSFYLLFVMVFAKPILGWVLKKYKPLSDVPPEPQVANIDDYSGLIKPALSILWGSALAIVVFAIPVGLWFGINGSLKDMSMVYVILSITLLAVALSFVPKIRNNGWNYKAGDYLFSLFFTLLGTLTYFKDLYRINPFYLLFTFIILFGSVFIHIILCKIFRIDRDTMIVTSAAGIMSPPFIPAIANAIKNKDLIAPGIAVGIVGLALGNVLGIFVVKLLMGFN